MNMNTLPGQHPLVKLARTGRQPVGFRKDGRPIYPVAGGAGDEMLERLISEREACLTRVQAVAAAAAESNRDLSDQDTEVIQRAQERVGQLDSQIDLLSFDSAISDRAADALRRNNVTVPGRSDMQYRSAGAALWDMLHLDARGSEGKEARQRYERELNRAAQHMGADAANTVAVAGGLGALVVRPVVGPVIDPTPAGRPFLSLLGVQPMDSPMGFSRPRISDPNIDQAPDVQGAGTANVGKEKAELVSRAFDIKLDPVETQTIGEYLNVSEKLRSLPIGAWNIILARFTKRRARKTERFALAEVRESTSAVPLAADADADAIYDAIWSAALQVFQKTGELPQWIAAGPTGWARLGALRDGAGRPLFPTLASGASVNSMGRMDASSFASQGPAGLPMAVSYGITDGAFILGNDASLEVYEYAYPMLEAVEPSVMGRQVAVASEVATYRPATDNMAGTATGNGAVIVAPAAP
jgi:hypothetical protein